MVESNLISSESLKRVIIRYDFTGSSVASIQPWIEKIKSKELSFFDDYNEAECGSMTIDMSHPEQVSIETGLGIRELTKGPLHVFQNGVIPGLKDNLVLEISHLFMVLTVNCNNYQSSEPYRNLMDELMISLLEHDKFIRIRRIGIRKINLFSFDTDEELKLNISPVAISCDFLDTNTPFLDRKYIDNYLLDYNPNDTQTVIVYQRGLRKQGDDSSDTWSVVIDMDCSKSFYQSQRFNEESLKSISVEMNQQLYHFFENSLTEEYKKHHERQSTEIK